VGQPSAHPAAATARRRQKTQPPPQAEKLSLENCDNTLCFLEDFKVLVCKQHCTAVVNLNTHLREQHATPAKLRERIIEHFSKYDVAEPKDAKLPEQPADPIEELGLH
jgi:hypothetical protein